MTAADVLADPGARGEGMANSGWSSASARASQPGRSSFTSVRRGHLGEVLVTCSGQAIGLCAAGAVISASILLVVGGLRSLGPGAVASW